MRYSEIATNILALVAGVLAYLFLAASGNLWTAKLIYLSHALLAFYFFAMLIAVQREENPLSERIERTGSAALFSLILFMEMLYAPAANYIFGTLIQKSFFLADILALLWFLIFFFLFGIAAMVINASARNGILSNWEFFNNKKTFSLLKIIWPVAAIFAIYLYMQSPFIIISSQQ